MATTHVFNLMCCLLVLACLNHIEAGGSLSLFGGNGKWSSEETRFTLRTRKNQPESISAKDPSSIRNSKFDKASPTKFIIHGFDESESEDWVIEMYQSLLYEGTYNVIVVDWKKGAEGGIFDYGDAVDNVPGVGTKVALLIKELQTTAGMSLSDVHLIGFSIGAHVAGYAGKDVSGIARITGLDPAGFGGYEDAITSKRLHRTDAAFVDVLHTEITLLGIEKKIGHVDFYFHDGEDQPGCSMGIFWLRRSPSDSYKCDHRKAVVYFTGSIEGNQHTCSHYKTYVNGRRRRSCTQYGLHADKIPQ